MSDDFNDIEMKETEAQGLDDLEVTELPEDAPQVVKDAVARGKKVICIEDNYEDMEAFWLLKPTEKQLNLFVEVSGFRKKPLIAIKRLIKQRALHPDAQTMMARLDEKPMLGTALFDKVNEALGGSREFDVRVF